MLMSRSRAIGILSLFVASLAILGFAGFQDQQIDRKQLREMLVQLGYELQDIVKEEGKEKVSSKFTRNGLDIPIGYEISPSNSYIWLTVNLGTAPTEGSAKTLALLKQNSKIQPTFFYITDSGRLMAALPIENRAVTNVVLRLRSESLAENIDKTKDVWQE